MKTGSPPATKADIQMLTQAIDGLVGKVDGFEDRFEGIEGSLKVLSAKVSGIDDRFDRLERRIDSVESNLEERQSIESTSGCLTTAPRSSMSRSRHDEEQRQQLKEHAERLTLIEQHLGLQAALITGTVRPLTGGPIQ